MSITCPFMDGVVKDIVFNFMEAHGLTRITADFNGEEDSGSFNSELMLEFNDPQKYIEYPQLYKLIQNYRIPNPPPGFTESPTMEEFILTLSQRIEEESNHGIDWYNNDGGEGKVEWILEGEGEDGETYHRGICLTVSARVIQYDTHHFTIQNHTESGELIGNQEKE